MTHKTSAASLNEDNDSEYIGRLKIALDTHEFQRLRYIQGMASISGLYAKSRRCGIKLGLRAQEMALLRIREIAALSAEFACGYKVKDVLVLPKSFTKGALAMAAMGNKNQ